MPLSRTPAETAKKFDKTAKDAVQERFYKLTSLKSVPFHHPLWCSVKYGPWLAIAKETESCIDGAPATWEFSIVEVPEVSLLWFGYWEDMPAYPSLQVIMGDLVPAGPPTSLPFTA